VQFSRSVTADFTYGNVNSGTHKTAKNAIQFSFISCCTFHRQNESVNLLTVPTDLL